MKTNTSLTLIMKRLSFLLMIGILVISCGKDNDAPAPYLNLNQTTLSLSSFPDASADVIVESNIEWQVSLTSGADWLQLNKTSGKGNDTIHVSVIKDNIGMQPRTASITVIPANTSITLQAQATIEQKPFNIQLLSKKILGGNDEDNVAALATAADGSRLLAGWTKSNNTGDVGVNHGLIDAWVVKLNDNGDTVWTRTIGGATEEKVYAAAATSDGGFAVAGYTFDWSGGANHGGSDFWIVKLKSNGDTAWTRLVGTSGWEYAYSVTTTPDDNIVVAGTTGSNGNGNDVLIAKLNSNGNLIWQKTFGGSGVEGAPSVSVGSDGSIFMGTYTLSNNTGDVGANHGYEDYWIMKLNPNGDKVWSKVLGGDKSDYLTSIKSTSDGGCIIVGNSYSQNGDVTGKLHSNGGYSLYYDLWVVKLNANGDKTWNTLVGGSLSDEAWGSASIATIADGGYVIAGYSTSSDGDVNTNQGLTDFWVFKLNNSGKKVWSRTYGGSNDDKATAVSMNADGSFWVAGNTTSNSTGDVSANHGNTDGWIVKIKEY